MPVYGLTVGPCVCKSAPVLTLTTLSVLSPSPANTMPLPAPISTSPLGPAFVAGALPGPFGL
jgi:hypothetical protein